MRFMYPVVLLLCPILVWGEVVISHVLYDPLVEAGGEAVELRNDGDIPIDLSGWTLATETSAKDVTLSGGTVLQPGAVFLIADEGWNESKDDPDWRGADHEETITLTNTNAGVALVDANGTVHDAVGWGDLAEIKAGLFEGTPTAHVDQGHVLARLQDTNNNEADFESQTAAFFDTNTIVVEAEVNDTEVSARIAEDDDLAEGVQIKPPHKKITIISNQPGKATLGDKIVELVEVGDAYSGVLFLDGLRAGSHTVLVSGSSSTELTFEYLPFKAFTIKTRQIKLSEKGKVELVNEGNTPLTVVVQARDLKAGNQTLSRGYLFIDGKAMDKSVELGPIEPGQQGMFTLEFKAPRGIRSGRYTTTMVIKTT